MADTAGSRRPAGQLPRPWPLVGWWAGPPGRPRRVLSCSSLRWALRDSAETACGEVKGLTWRCSLPLCRTLRVCRRCAAALCVCCAPQHSRLDSLPQPFLNADSAFKQQRLKAWQPILTPKWGGCFLASPRVLPTGAATASGCREWRAAGVHCCSLMPATALPKPKTLTLNHKPVSCRRGALCAVWL